MATENDTPSHDIGRLDYMTVSNRLDAERVRLRNAASSLLVTTSLLGQPESPVPTSNTTEALWLVHETLERVIEQLDENRVLAPTEDGTEEALNVHQRIASAIRHLQAAWTDVLEAPEAPGYQRDDEGRFEDAYRQIENVQSSLEEWESREDARS
jgi:hypothetical protein